MKRKPTIPESSSDTDSESDYGDNMKINPQLLFIINHDDIDYQKNEEVRKPKKKKTKLDIKREEIQKQIDKINAGNGDVKSTLTDRILFSELPIEKKAIMLSELERSTGSDKSKYIGYVERVLAVPFGVIKPISTAGGGADVSGVLLKLRENMDKSIFGHHQTKEEIIDYVSSIIRNPSAKGNILAFESSPGMGKCHAKDTGILMYDGSVKMVQNLEKGDVIMGDDSTPRTITGLGSGRDKMYEIHHKISGVKYVVNSEHILCLTDVDNAILEIPVKEFLKQPLDVQMKYFGYSNSVNFVRKQTENDPRKEGENISGKTDSSYKVNSFDVRCNFLCGLIEKHGIRHMNCIEIIIPDLEMVNDVLFIARSLGYIAGYDTISGILIVTIKGNNLLYLKYPNLYWPFTSKENISITELGVDDYYGMTIDGNSRYIMDNMVVTHNTKFARALGASLGLPFQQISLGGISDPNILLGHDCTYIGSKPGRIYDAISKSKCMNPVIYLDECDKITETKSSEMNGILTHLLDKEQNMDFHDNFLGDIHLDLSNVLFILSFNNKDKVDPIVLNRLKVIKIKENTIDEKIEIVRDFTINEICKNLGLSKDLFSISDNVIRHVITDKTNKEPGMRNINKNFQTIFNKINTKMLLEKSPQKKIERITQGFKNSDKLTYNEMNEIVITSGLVDSLLFSESDELPIHHFMYL